MPKSVFWGIFNAIVTLSLDQNLTCSSLPWSPLVVKVWPNSVNKYPRYLANNVCLGLTHACTDARTLWKHDAFSHYVGRGIKTLM